MKNDLRLKLGQCAVGPWRTYQAVVVLVLVAIKIIDIIKTILIPDHKGVLTSGGGVQARNEGPAKLVGDEVGGMVVYLRGNRQDNRREIDDGADWTDWTVGEI
jgi:hypothetical protein